MSQQTIDPGRIATPMQLLAACLALLVIVEPAMITGAINIQQPAWAPGVLVIAAVLNVPLILGFFLLLQTRYRVQLLADDKFLEHERELRRVTPELEQILASLDVTLRDVIAGRLESSGDVVRAGDSASRVARAVEDLAEPARRVDPVVLREIAVGFFVSSRWSEAAAYFDEYVANADASWEEQFSRGVAHANRRAGAASDLSALDAYTRAETLMPADAPQEMVARLYSYRGAILKRLGRLDDALRDLKVASHIAQTPYERVDVTYNLACVYALQGEVEEALVYLRKLKDLGGLSLIAPHIVDYFANLHSAPEFWVMLEESSDLGRTRPVSTAGDNGPPGNGSDFGERRNT